MAITKWIPTTNLLMLRRMGKLIEELGVLSEVIVQIQSGVWFAEDQLTKEIADVLAQLDETVGSIEGLRKLTVSWSDHQSSPYVYMLNANATLSAVAARCVIQGIDEVDPSTQETNHVRLERHIGKAYGAIDSAIRRFGLDTEFIDRRRHAKRSAMQEWEALFKGTSNDTERLEWLTRKIPGNVVRAIVGELTWTGDLNEWREAIDGASHADSERLDPASENG